MLPLMGKMMLAVRQMMKTKHWLQGTSLATRIFAVYLYGALALSQMTAVWQQQQSACQLTHVATWSAVPHIPRPYDLAHCNCSTSCRQARLLRQQASSAAAAAAAGTATRGRGRGRAARGRAAAAAGQQQMATGWDQLPTFVLAKVTDSNLLDRGFVTLAAYCRMLPTVRAGTAAGQLLDKCEPVLAKVMHFFCWLFVPPATVMLQDVCNFCC
jgi:hypothetical protein